MMVSQNRTLKCQLFLCIVLLCLLSMVYYQNHLSDDSLNHSVDGSTGADVQPSSVKEESNIKNRIKKTGKLAYPYVFENPNTYKGPVVEGWPPSKNRSMPIYIRPDDDSTFLLRPNSESLRNSQIIVLIHSAPDAFENRQAIRDTWATYTKQDINTSVLFIFGLPQKERDLQFNLQSKIEDEHSNHDDLVQVDFYDHYNNLTLKTMHMLKYFLNRTNFGRGQQDEDSGPHFLFKVDEDSFINLPLLHRQLILNDPPSDLSFHQNQTLLSFIMGKLYAKKGLRKAHKIPNADRKKEFAGKWLCPEYMFSGNYYPEFFSGSGYILSRTSSECLYSVGLELPFFHLEDVFLTGFAADFCQVEKRNNDGFHPHLDITKVLEKDIHFHYVNNTQKRILLEKFDVFNRDH